MGDQRSTLRQTACAAQHMLDSMRELFDPEAPEDGFSLEIQGGKGGARLSHSHGKQYRYVEQTLMLWREILGQLTRLWHLCEKDLLFAKRHYSLTDTGQVSSGLVRLALATSKQSLSLCPPHFSSSFLLAFLFASPLLVIFSAPSLFMPLTPPLSPSWLLF